MELNKIHACDLLRITATGGLRSHVLRLTDALVVRTNDGESKVLGYNSLVLVVDSGHAYEELVQRLLDWAELGLHAGYSARTLGEAIRTEFDIRTTLSRKDVGEDPIPF